MRLSAIASDSVRPPGDAWSDGRVFMELAERRGLYHPATIRKEMASAIAAFKAFKVNATVEARDSKESYDLGEQGVRLLP